MSDKDKKINLNEDNKNWSSGSNPQHGKQNKNMNKKSGKQDCGCGCHDDISDDRKW